MSMPLTLEVESYHVKWAFGNYIHASNVEKLFTTCNNGKTAMMITLASLNNNLEFTIPLKID